MFLLINTSAKDFISLTLFKGNFVEQKSYPAPNRDLLLTIENFLQANNVSVQDVQGVATVVGVGSFTSTRIATTVANTWAYSQKIPVSTVSLAEAENLADLEKKLSQTLSGTLISATYSGEPNVGKTK